MSFILIKGIEFEMPFKKSFSQSIAQNDYIIDSELDKTDAVNLEDSEILESDNPNVSSIDKENQSKEEPEKLTCNSQYKNSVSNGSSKIPLTRRSTIGSTVLNSDETGTNPFSNDSQFLTGKHVDIDLIRQFDNLPPSTVYCQGTAHVNALFRFLCNFHNSQAQPDSGETKASSIHASRGHLRPHRHHHQGQSNHPSVDFPILLSPKAFLNGSMQQAEVSNCLKSFNVSRPVNFHTL